MGTKYIPYLRAFAHTAVFIAVFLPQSLVLCIYFVILCLCKYTYMCRCLSVYTGMYRWRPGVDDICHFCQEPSTLCFETGTLFTNWAMLAGQQEPQGFVPCAEVASMCHSLYPAFENASVRIRFRFPYLRGTETLY